MDCVNHPGEQATAYCQNCGKAMCAACTRPQAGGQILCEPCSMAWQSVQAPFTPAIPGAPNPVLATLLGFIPGVGAMYNGQFVKGFIHVAVFAVLVSISDHFGVFGIFVAAWIAYQVFDAHQTAKARRDGDPLPDPLGLNELAGWFHTGMQSEFRRAQGFPPPPVAGPTGGAAQQPHYAPPQAAPRLANTFRRIRLLIRIPTRAAISLRPSRARLRQRDLPAIRLRRLRDLGLAIQRDMGSPCLRCGIGGAGLSPSPPSSSSPWACSSCSAR